MLTLQADTKLIARCGLYCGACGRYLRGRCPGCHENAKATWCKVRACCEERGFATCAECQDVPDPNDCRKFNNVISKVIGLVLNSDRQACVLKIRDLGALDYARFMAERGIQSLPRRGRA
jgi:hypothetical protein